jgi:2-polyprenyl-6-methoxyphenol hydroxylase-like FAD-dependent oxidoreductase
MECQHQTVLIIGAGIAGLALAQGLKKACNLPDALIHLFDLLTKHQKGISFLVFERDASAVSRPQGWALTIHFSLPLLMDFLPNDIANRLHTARIDQAAGNDQSHSVFLNLETCTSKWSLPPTYGNRMRVVRERLRNMLMEGIEERIMWEKHLSSYEVGKNCVKARFSDGSCYNGELLAGVDGCHSTVRSLLYGAKLSQPSPIPACFLGTQALATETQMKPLLALDETLFQGCHPSHPAWMWFSVMERPNPRAAAFPTTKPLWRVQICLSWLSSTGNQDVPKTDSGRIALMRQKSKDFHPTFRNVFNDILSDSHGPVVNVPLEIWWLPHAEGLDTSKGRVTLAGDAAHTMPLCS